MQSNRLGLYLHIPFCVKKCSYCDFLSFPAEDSIKERYLRQLLQEIEAASFREYQTTTIFIGGGTPSILPANAVTQLLDTIRRNFAVAEDAEITIEANPGTLTREKCKAYRTAGINRLSLGLQSADQQELRRLGRIHTFAQFKESYAAARAAGFKNINVDLMFGLPGQKPDSWRRTLEEVIALAPEHISAYGLIIEAGTPFYDQYQADTVQRAAGKSCRYLPDEEEEREMYAAALSLLPRFGYQRYEISNFAKPGFACRHNCGYWRRVNYLGLGLGASSLFQHQRFKNTEQMERYLHGTCMKEEQEQMERYLNGTCMKEAQEQLTLRQEMEEFMFLGLRMMSGVSQAAFRLEFGLNYEAVYGEVTKKMVREGLLTQQGQRITLTERGIDVSNYVLSQFLLS